MKMEVGQVYIHDKKGYIYRIETISPDREYVDCVEVTGCGFSPRTFTTGFLKIYCTLQPHYDTPLYQALNGKK